MELMNEVYREGADRMSAQRLPIIPLVIVETTANIMRRTSVTSEKIQTARGGVKAVGPVST